MAEINFYKNFIEVASDVGDIKAGPFSHGAFTTYVKTMPMSDGLGDRKAKSGAVLVPWLPFAVESLENMRQFISGNAAAVIPDGNMPVVGFGLERDMDGCAVGGKLDGIVQDCEKHLAQSPIVTTEQDRLACGWGHDLDFLGGTQLPCSLHSVLQGICQVQVGGFQLEIRILEPRQFEQILH